MLCSEYSILKCGAEPTNDKKKQWDFFFRPVSKINGDLMTGAHTNITAGLCSKRVGRTKYSCCALTILLALKVLLNISM